MNNFAGDILNEKEDNVLELPSLEGSEYKAEVIERLNALLELLCDFYGTDKLILRASKLDALDLLGSANAGERLLALKKIISDNPVLDEVPDKKQAAKTLKEIEEGLAEQIALRSVEEDLERKISIKLQEKHEEFLKEIKLQIIKEDQGPESIQTLRKLEDLEKMEKVNIVGSAMEKLRPQKLQEIVGQEKAVKALISKLASPFPQHVILYGPPGVGKTTAARIALSYAKKINKSVFHKKAPFIEANGATLRWDPRETINPLLGSIHDPIYQGARRDLAESGIPEPKLGLVTDAHGGVLFIDEIGEIEPTLMNKFLKVLEDKRVYYKSSYYDENDDRIPQYIRKIFKEGAPADFILVGATTCSPEQIDPAIRSRCAEVFFEPLNPEHIKKIVKQSAKRLKVKIDGRVPEIISEYTIEGRKANSILADAYGFAVYQTNAKKEKTEEELIINEKHIYEVIHSSRLTPNVSLKASAKKEIGSIFGLGVSGYIGSIIEIEAITFPAKEKGKGTVRFNDTAGSMAKDSVFNAASVIRKITGEEIANYDIHINIVGGGNIDGPSAGLAISMVVLSSILKLKLRQDVAVTGEISLQGKIKSIGGIAEKIYGARQAGMKRVIIPVENKKDLSEEIEDIEVIAVSTIEEALRYIAESDGTERKIC